MQKRLVLENAFNQFREKAADFIWSKLSITLPFYVQSKYDFEFIFDQDNGFHALMIHLIKADRKYEGAMQHKMIQLQYLGLTVASKF